MRVWISGGGGFVESNIVRAAVDGGHDVLTTAHTFVAPSNAAYVGATRSTTYAAFRTTRCSRPRAPIASSAEQPHPYARSSNDSEHNTPLR